MKRDLSLDVLRGIMLLVMAADHFGEPIFQHLYELAGYVSAAEGFVFLSGMLVAVVYSRYYAAGGWVLEQRVWQRAKVIYLYHVVVLLAVFVFTVATVWSGAYWQSFATEMQVEPLRALFSGLLLVYQPPMLDILPMYVLLMLLAPLPLRMMLRFGNTGVLLVVLGSVGLWWAAQYGGGYALLGLVPDALAIRVGAFDYMAWQLIFVLGMVLGFLRFSGQARLPAWSGGWLLLSLLLIVSLYLLRHGWVPLDSMLGLAWLVDYPHIARSSMGWLRLLDFLAFVYVVSVLVAWQQRYGLFNWLARLGHWLAFLGQHSLQVFAYHLVVLYCYIPFRWGDWALTDPQKWVWLVVFLASLTLPAWLHARYQAGKRQYVFSHRALVST